MGEPPKVIQQRLEHGSISVTMDRYGHLMDGHDEGTAERLYELSRVPDAYQTPDQVIPIERKT